MENKTFFLTIGITSFNRYFYLKALLDSLRCLSRIKFQFIIVDNCSSEKEIKPYLEKLKSEDIIHHVFLRETSNRNWTNDEYIAKNLIIENAKSDTILFLQDDNQFITNEFLLTCIVEDFKKTNVSCCELNAVRRTTILNSFINTRQIKVNNSRFWIPTNNHFHTMGLFKKKIFDIVGLYPIDWPQTQEFWGRSEDWYDAKLKEIFPNMQLNISSWIPHFAPVWNDPRGGYAFIRGNTRYGHYLPPKDDLYYLKLTNDTYKDLEKLDRPVCFSECCISSGWNYAIDSGGDQIKYPQSKVMIEGPSTDII